MHPVRKRYTLSKNIYMNFRSEVHIYFFDDRMEIYSSSGMVDDLYDTK